MGDHKGRPYHTPPVTGDLKGRPYHTPPASNSTNAKGESVGATLVVAPDYL